MGLAVSPLTASASQLVDRDGRNVRIAISGNGQALLTYVKGGVTKHVLVWGALNARPPDRGSRQVKFSFDYSGNQAKSFSGSCARYDGPTLPFLVAACKAPDGSYWAVQEWPQPLPDLGYAPWLPAQHSVWMDVSHWRGPLARLSVYTDWVYSGEFHSLFGRFTYNGAPVHGFGTTHYGAPTDGFGRLIFLDTYDSTYGAGWRRENSFVPHNPTGVFCYGFYQFDPREGGYQHPPGQTAVRGPGVGSKYRLIGRGPGVTPDVQAIVTDPGDYGPSQASYRLKQWALLNSFIGSDQQCRQGRGLNGAGVAVQKSWLSDTTGGTSSTNFSLGDLVVFNVTLAKAPRGTGNSTVTWVSPTGNTFSTPLDMQPGGTQATAEFALPLVRRYAGKWTVRLVVSGLALVEDTFQVAGTSVGDTGGGAPPGGSPPPVGTAPANTVMPQIPISDQITVGSTVTVSNGEWNGSPTSFQYAWYRCVGNTYQCSAIAGATDASYLVTTNDVGDSLYAAVTAISAGGQTTVTSQHRTPIVA